jgi:hypothetical protein
MKRFLLILLCALIASVGMVSCTGSGTTGGAAKSTAPALEPADVLAWVNDVAVPKVYLDHMIAQLPPFLAGSMNTPDGRKRMAENLVNIELIYQKAQSDGFMKKDGVQNKLDQMKKQVAYAEYMTKAMEAIPEPDEAAAKAYYDANPTMFVNRAQKPEEGKEAVAPETKPFEEVKGQVVQMLKRQAQQAAYDTIVTELKTGATIRYNEKALGFKSPEAEAEPALPDNILAQVGNVSVTKEYVEEMVAAMPPQMSMQVKSPQGMKDLVEKLVNVELVSAKAQKEGFFDKKEVQEKFDLTSRQALYHEYMNDLMKQAGVEPGDTEAKEFYDTNTASFVRKDADGNETTVPFEQAKEAIIQRLKMQAQRDFFADKIEEFKTAASIKYNDEVLGVKEVAADDLSAAMKNLQAPAQAPAPAAAKPE